MRTTLDLPEELLDIAMQMSNTKTKTKVIILALEELVRKTTITDLKKYKGKVDLDIDLDTLRGRRDASAGG
ncbi:MAG: type II toxin-antitoxin system VapB family antitoxin [Anaerolineae bacterium]